MTRLDSLLALRKQIDAEIEREQGAMARARQLAVRVNIATTRGSWNTRVFNAACQRYGVTGDAVLDGARDRQTLNARHTAMWLMRDAGRTYAEVADELGCDHTTVINGVRRVERTPRLLGTAHQIRAVLTGDDEVAA